MKNMNDKILGHMSNDEFFELLNYRCLGSVEEFMALKRSNIPLKISEVRVEDNLNRVYRCPLCLKFGVSEGMTYCPKCGQRIAIPDTVMNGGECVG